MGQRGKVFPHGVLLPNVLHLVGGEFSGSSPFDAGITTIVRRGPKEQMVRADTGRCIAMVEHKESIRNRSNVPLIGQPMRSMILSMEVKASVAVLEEGAMPQPAAFRIFCHERPEARRHILVPNSGSWTPPAVFAG